MKALAQWRKPYVGHAIRVAAAATVIIGAMYVCVVVAFDLVERHHLVGQIDTRLQQRLAQAVRRPAAAGSVGDYDNAHDVDDAPVFLWRVTDAGHSTALTTGAPALPASAWSPSKPSLEAQLGTEQLPTTGRRIGQRLGCCRARAGQHDRIESELLLLEAIAGRYSSWPCSSVRCS